MWWLYAGEALKSLGKMVLVTAVVSFVAAAVCLCVERSTRTAFDMACDTVEDGSAVAR